MLGRFETRGDIGIIFVNHPPVNAISVGVREAIIHGLSQGKANAAVKAVVIACEGRTFMCQKCGVVCGGRDRAVLQLHRFRP